MPIGALYMVIKVVKGILKLFQSDDRKLLLPMRSRETTPEVEILNSIALENI